MFHHWSLFTVTNHQQPSSWTITKHRKQNHHPQWDWLWKLFQGRSSLCLGTLWCARVMTTRDAAVHWWPRSVKGAIGYILGHCQCQLPQESLYNPRLTKTLEGFSDRFGGHGSHVRRSSSHSQGFSGWIVPGEIVHFDAGDIRRTNNSEDRNPRTTPEIT